MNHALLFAVSKVIPIRVAGVHRIGSFLREQGWDVEVIDFSLGWSLEELKTLGKSRITSNTVFVGFSSFFNSWSDTLSLFTSWLKTTYPNVKTVMGGQDIANTHAKNIDYWIDGYAEMALLELVKYFISPGSVNLKYSSDFFPKKLIKANTFYPAYPMRSLLVKYEKRDFIQSYEWLGTEVSRGCKFQCKFCNFPILGVKEDYSRDASDFNYQLQHNFDNWGTTNYSLTDETFNDRTEKIIKFADVVDRLNFQPYFIGFLRADLMISRPQDIEHIARMRFFSQYYGVESINHESAKSIGKGMHPDKLLPGLIDIKKYFKQQGPYRGEISLIIGLPHETKESARRGFQWLIDNWKDEAISINPLFIPIKDYNPSVLSKKWKDCGYKEMSQEAISQKIMESTSINFFPETEKELCWEHENMNIFDAIKIHTDWKEECNKNNYFKISPWDFAVETIRNSCDFDQLLKLGYNSLENSVKEKNELDFVNKYKKKKLSL